MLVVKNYYERAKVAYRIRRAKQTALKQTQPALSPSDQLKGSSGANDGQLSARDFGKLLEGDFTKLDEKTKNFFGKNNLTSINVWARQLI